MLADHLARKNLAVVHREILEQRELLRCELDRSDVPRNGSIDGVEDKIGVTYLCRLDIGLTANERSHTSQKLTEVERFAEIIISARVQSLDTVLDTVECREHKDWGRDALGTQVTTDLTSILLR